MLRRDLDLMSLCTALKTWLSESADCNHIGLEERRHPLNQGRDDMAKTKGEARTNNKEKTQPKLREIPGLRSRRKQPEPRLRKQPAPRPSKRPGSRPSKRLEPRPRKRSAPGPTKRLKSGPGP